MNIQFTLTVPEGKRLIAEGIVSLPEIKRALESGKILLKGGTTVSAISERLIGRKLRISGRISPLGTKGSRKNVSLPHSILIMGHNVYEVDDKLEETVNSMGPEDICLISANAIDSEGNAAMMAGAPLGGNPGRIISGLMAEGVNIIIPVGLEKLIPGKIQQAVAASGRKKPDTAMGMAVGLIPLTGRVFTEIDAIKAISGLDAVVIGRGGICGAEGASVFAVEGPKKQCKNLMDIIRDIKGKGISGDEMTLEECRPGSPGCKYHLACMYREGFK